MRLGWFTRAWMVTGMATGVVMVTGAPPPRPLPPSVTSGNYSKPTSQSFNYYDPALLSPNTLTNSDETGGESKASFLIYALDIARTLTAAKIENKMTKYTKSEMQGRDFPLFGFLSFLMLLLNSLLLIIQNVNINNNNNNNNNDNNNNNNNNNDGTARAYAERLAGLDLYDVTRA
ncbi:GATA zinc finger domain-containing protein 8-like [Portunus trituberculatus]|uniref:GATA zinc finger domain-containing protein 8-like n=1 Tax=Portunus trituberculatus TaxID=210409 RepID=UPI001E1D1D9C|nr:GATA zinc finger domain-containing protein 8-like [Portunus trituberculatus]